MVEKYIIDETVKPRYQRITEKKAFRDYVANSSDVVDLSDFHKETKSYGNILRKEEAINSRYTKMLERKNEREAGQEQVKQEIKPIKQETKPEIVIKNESVNRIEKLGNPIQKDYDKQKNEFIDPAIDDKVNALETKSQSINTPEKMIAVAKARGWTDIKVSGDERFKKAAWEAGAKAGIDVEGYTPTPAEKEKVVNKVMAKDFTASPEEAAKKYPELKSSFNAIKAIEEKNRMDGLTKEQSAVVENKAREILAKTIENNQHKSLTVNKERQKQQQNELTL